MPGTIHSVITPVPSVFRGGHYFAGYSLHRTLFTMISTALRGHYLTNTQHPEVSWQLLTRIMLSWASQIPMKVQGQVVPPSVPDVTTIEGRISVSSLLILIGIMPMILPTTRKSPDFPTAVQVQCVQQAASRLSDFLAKHCRIDRLLTSCYHHLLLNWFTDVVLMVAVQDDHLSDDGELVRDRFRQLASSKWGDTLEIRRKKDKFSKMTQTELNFEYPEDQVTSWGSAGNLICHPHFCHDGYKPHLDTTGKILLDLDGTPIKIR